MDSLFILTTKLPPEEAPESLRQKNMLPEFPEFKKLELSDKSDIENITSKFPPYSDFNFVSMWRWDFRYKYDIV